MLKQVHKFLTALVIGCFLLTPSVVCALDDASNSANDIPVSRGISQKGDVELIQNEVNVEDLNVEPINTGKIKERVVPDPHKEGKKVIGLFLKIMMFVLFVSIFLYVALFFAKRYFTGHLLSSDSEELDDFDLSTPNSKNDALKSFLNKTK